MSTQQNLLCVDDESGILSSLMRALRHERFNVLTASNSGEALKLLSENEIQVILIDQHMPDIDGLNLIKKMIWQWLIVTNGKYGVYAINKLGSVSAKIS